MGPGRKYEGLDVKAPRGLEEKLIAGDYLNRKWLVF